MRVKHRYESCPTKFGFGQFPTPQGAASVQLAHKKMLAFDMDDTLAVTKSPVSEEMASLLVTVLKRLGVPTVEVTDSVHTQQLLSVALTV